MKFLHATLFVLVAAIAGCGDRHIDLYLYGAANSCFPMEGYRCNRLKLYDKVDLMLFVEKQQVSYVQTGVRLDEGNTVFRRLDNCKVIDHKNFSCKGLVRIDERFTDTSVFNNLHVSRASLPYWYSYYLSQPIRRSTLSFFERFESWIWPIAIVLVIFALVRAFS